MSIKVGKSFKALIAAGAALVMAASMAACGPSAGTPSEAKSSDTGTSSSANAKARSLDEIKKSGKIKIAVFSDKAPFGYVDKDGKYQGYDVYFAEQLAKDLGVDPEYTSVDPAARVDVLTSNKVDLVLANFTVTDERKEKVDFAKPYMKVALGVVSPESAQITDVSQLDGKTLIIAKGTTAETWFEKNAPNVKLQKYDQYADAYNALLDGRGDAFSTDNTEVLAWAKSNKGFKVGITHLGDDDTIAPAVQKGNTELLNFVNDEIVKLEKQRKEERAATVPVDNSGATRPAVPKRTKSEQGIVVEGLSNCLVKFSKCCTPVPGDEIVGFITRGYGVSVHRCDCPNAAIERRKPEERGRWIKVSWGTDVKESYQTALDIYAKDRLDLVLDVSAALSSSQTRVASINATTTADGFAVIHLSIFISDAQHLAAVMRRLHQISGVMKVDRPAG